MNMKLKDNQRLEITIGESNGRYIVTGLGFSTASLKKRATVDVKIRIRRSPDAILINKEKTGSKINTTRSPLYIACPKGFICLGMNSAPPATTPCADPLRPVTCLYSVTAAPATRYRPHRPKRSLKDTRYSVNVKPTQQGKKHNLANTESREVQYRRKYVAEDYINSVDIWMTDKTFMKAKDALNVIAKSLKTTVY